ncbi:hypothetical protein PV10_07447 [Exophiala mesophila]|uniref:NAD(P)-binding domain-containing protein n=1 Tax=Exophiala mesophila TaxID=212818 RepID=A0A0D1XPS5_EXOME|nr:uncharacterized protein PV10_07447 [Exophiala mesophila]KIV90106.1 hypothetical protein PV10_07447 [Exophiala mesophila]
MTDHLAALKTEHILVLGATGRLGIVFINTALALKQPPLLTLFVRPGSESKLPASVSKSAHVRVIQGQIDDAAAIKKALSPSTQPDFPTVTCVLSIVGTYESFKPLFTRDKSHPVADALRTVILPTMKSCGVSRILAPSTAAAFTYPGERESMSRLWRVTLHFTPLMPQGHAEMVGITEAVMDAGEKDPDLNWVLFRVPHMTNQSADLKIVAGYFSPTYKAIIDVSRGSLSKWLLQEICTNEWSRKAPSVANASS